MYPERRVGAELRGARCRTDHSRDTWVGLMGLQERRGRTGEADVAKGWGLRRNGGLVAECAWLLGTSAPGLEAP